MRFLTWYSLCISPGPSAYTNYSLYVHFVLGVVHASEESPVEVSFREEVGGEEGVVCIFINLQVWDGD